jgi:hypothetical protein
MNDDILSTTDPETEPMPSALPPRLHDRRRFERRGTRVRVHRFGGDRRLGKDRRTHRRRGFDRHPLSLEVEIRQGGESMRTRTLDLSVLGARVVEPLRLPVGAMVRLTFHLPDDLAEFPLVTWAQVVSHDPRGIVGYRFVGLRPCDARRIGRLLAPRRRSPLASGHSF